MRGKPPRWSDDRNPSLITLMDLFGQPIPDLPGVPPALLEVLRRGMVNDPGARPSAEELRDLLAAVPIERRAGGAAPPAAPTSGGPIYGTPAPSYPVSGAPTSGGPTPQGVYVSRSYTPPPTSAPPAGPPSADSTPTVPANPRRRKLRWWLGGLGVLVVIAVSVAATWYATGRGDVAGDGTANPTPATTVVISRALPGCLVPLPGGGRCPTDVECFGPVASSGSATKLPCAGRHTWETFAEGDLPASATAVDHASVRAQPVVRQVCAEASFVSVTLLMNAKGWVFDVLPPDPESFAAGDRTYRCLAGKGRDGLTGPTLTN
jgi:hypothetical protein